MRARLPVSMLAYCAFALLLTIAPVFAASKADSQEAEQIVAQLDTHAFLFDMHGNGSHELERLEELRFAATQAVIHGIERAHVQADRRPIEEALYFVLGFVKDPQAIDWLGDKLRTQPVVFEWYLRGWRRFVHVHEWTTQHARWISFWQGQLVTEQDEPKRVDILEILADFDDAQAIAFFESQRSIGGEAKEVLLIEDYLYRHGRAVDAERLQPAIASLARSRANAEFLAERAEHLRHEMFVPYLIELVDVAQEYVSPARYPAADALRKITLAPVGDSKSDWQAWYAEHKGSARQTWREQVLTEFRDTLLRDPIAAHAAFEKSLYNWNDIELLPFITNELAPHAEFRDEIAGWINLTHTDFLHERLRPLARLVGRDPGKLAPWARGLLINLGYLPRPAQTWKEFVALANSLV